MTPPVRYLNFFSGRDAGGRWQRLRAITLAVQMRSGEKIGDFGHRAGDVGPRIFFALVFQFKSAIKPLIVFAAIPFGVVGALGAP